MKITALLITVSCIQLSAASYSQKISLNQRNMPLEDVLKEIKRQTNYFFLYDLDLIQQKSKPVNIDVKNVEIEEVMAKALKSQPFSWEIKSNTILITPITDQLILNKIATISVSGKVVDENGQGLAGASIKVKGTSTVVLSDANGSFTLTNIDDNAILQLSYIGYTRIEVKVKEQMGTITLSPAINALTSVVVTGYTNYTRNQSTNATSLVTAEKINQVPGLTLDQILQGRVPGMSVISTSGQPGQSAAVVIRGIGSISGSNAPLYILDGIPVENGYFQTINPEDIESATVLKDGAAKALYASRGSNGVILFTTKKGKVGRVVTQYISQYGFNNLSRPNFTMMNTEQRLRFEEEVGQGTPSRNIGPGWTHSPKNPAYAAGTAASRLRSDAILDSLRGINIDWRDMFFQRGSFQEQQVGISGGSEKLRFYNSLNYYKQDGVAKRTGLERYSLRSNLDYKDNKLSGNVNLSLGYSNSSFTEGEGGTGLGTAMASVYYSLPYENPYAPDGTLIHPGNRGAYFGDREGGQAIERLENSTSKTDQLKSIISTSLAYQILPSLKIFTRAGIDYRNSTDVLTINPDSYYGSRLVANTLGGKGRFDEGTRRNFSLISTSGITFNKVFANKHDIEVSGFYEFVKNNYNAFNYTGFGIDSRLQGTPAGITNSNATFIPTVRGGKTQSELTSFITTARYTYNDKYTLTGSYRYDGSTRVALDNTWHGFYSVGANWNVKKESFLSKTDLITDLVARASYGITASPFGGPSDFAYLSTYAVGGTGQGTSYGGIAALRAFTAGNIDYDWEYINEFNTGIDLALFANNRLRLTADYYNRITTNMFVDQPPSATSGFLILSLSSGKMRNRGVEFDLSGDVIRGRGFMWTLGVNAGYNKNKILHLTDVTNSLPDGSRVIREGYPLGSYYAPEWAGVNPANGEAQYYNLDGSISTTYSPDVQSIVVPGSLYPSLTGGFSTTVSYKGISASALLSFVTDVVRHNNEDFYNENQRYATSNQSIRMLENRWKAPGDNAILQRFDIPRNFTSKDIEDASFLRLRNVNIGYAIPKSFLEKSRFVKGAKVFVQGQNLYTWTKWRGLDPENNDIYGRFQYPNTRTYTLGLNVNF